MDGNSFCFAARWTSVRQTVSLDTVKLLTVSITVFITGIGVPFWVFPFPILGSSISHFGKWISSFWEMDLPILDNGFSNIFLFVYRIY